MDSTVVAQHREQRFRTLYDAVHGDLLRFVRRRVHPRHAEDVVGEVMLVAWRRMDDVPSDLSSARAWVFGVARHTLLNTSRRERKQEALLVRLAETAPVLTEGDQSADSIATRVDIAETESMQGSVPISGRLPFTTTDGWFIWVSGYAGSDVTGVTAHPPVGPDVEATVSHGRFSAWWPAGEAHGGHPGVSGAWSYTVILTDGTSRRAAA